MDKDNEDNKNNRDKSIITENFLPYLHNIPDSPIKYYIQNRVIDQIVWYDRKSIEKQRRFKQLSIVMILLNAIIPVVTLLSEYGIWVQIFIVSISSAAVAINAILALCSYKDLWVQYRSNCEMLKSILHRYFNHSGEFQSIADQPDQCAQLLIMQCEECLTKEFQAWTSVIVQTSSQNSIPPNQGDPDNPPPQSPDSTNS